MTRRPANAATSRRASSGRRVRGSVAIAWAALLGIVILWSATSSAQPAPAQRSETEVRAGFLLGFPAYIVWPKSALGEDAPLVIAVADSPAVAAELRTRLEHLRTRDDEAKRSGGRPAKPRRAVEVREIDSSRPDAAAGLEGCHILYLSGAVPTENAVRLLDRVAGSAVLTVEDRGRVGAPLSAIELYVENQRIRFGVRLGALRARGLEADSRMLRLGTIIDETAERPAPTCPEGPRGEARPTVLPIPTDATPLPREGEE